MKNLLLKTSTFLFFLQITLAARGVCVFEINNTLLNVSESLSKAAIAACKSKGYGLGINTVSSKTQKVDIPMEKLVAMGLKGLDHANAWLFHGPIRTIQQDKFVNMSKLSKFYGSTNACTLLFDNDKKIVDFLNEKGFAAVQVNTDGQGISSKNLADAMDRLKNCDGESAGTRIRIAQQNFYPEYYMKKISDVSRKLFSIFPRQLNNL